MRTRAQVQAWRQAATRQRREFLNSVRAAPTTTSIAVTVSGSRDACPDDNEQQPSPVPVLVTPPPSKKRKLSASAVSDTANKKISPSQRKPRATATLAKTSTSVETLKTSSTSAMTIRRALDYTETDCPRAERAVGAAVLEQLCGRPDDGLARLVGRADERREIARALADVRDSRQPRALFVIGPPGTGKSSCVADVIREHPTLQVVRLNCSTFANPSGLFTALGQELRKATDWHLPSLDAAALEDFLHSALHRVSSAQHVLVLDEVDHLVRLPTSMQTRVQAVLRFLVRWAHHPNSSIRFIGILNGIDMHTQIAEFLAHDPHPTGVVVFPSYTHDELVAIINAYAVAVTTGLCADDHLNEIVDPRAVELIARKVAARDGDARRAIGLLQRCARFCLQDGGAQRLTIREVLQCSAAAITAQATATKQQIQGLPRQPKLLLYAIAVLAPTESQPTNLDAVCEHLAYLQSRSDLAWLPRFHRNELQQHLGTLDCYALVKTTADKTPWKARLSSTVPIDALRRSFEGDELLRLLPMSGSTSTGTQSA